MKTSLVFCALLATVAVTADRAAAEAPVASAKKALSPFEDLVKRVNAANTGVVMSTTFDWLTVLHEEPGQPTHIECFGIDEDIVAEVYGQIRPNLADGNEVLTEVTGAVSNANRYGTVGNTSAGLADLANKVNGQSFFGCYLRYAPDPWSGIVRAFYVNTQTGYRVFTATRWSE